MRAALVVMARSPNRAIGQIKTRLAAALPDARDRAALYRAFLADTLQACRAVAGVALRVAYTPEGGSSGFAALGVNADELLPQRGPDLGARERAVFADLFATGFDRAVLVGSDLPTLPGRYLREAFARLRPGWRRLVLGPTRDGGYYLIGLARPARGGRPAVPDVFTGVRWSTPFALDDTLARAAARGWSAVLLPPWYDIDEAADLARLWRALRRPGTARRAPATAAVLRRLADEGKLVGILQSVEPGRRDRRSRAPRD